MDRLRTIADERGLLLQRRVIMPTEYDDRLVEAVVITVRGAPLAVYVDKGSFLVVHVRWDDRRKTFWSVPATCGQIAPEGSSIDPFEWLQGVQWVPSYPDGESRIPLKAPNWVIEVTGGEPSLGFKEG